MPAVTETNASVTIAVETPAPTSTATALITATSSVSTGLAPVAILDDFYRSNSSDIGSNWSGSKSGFSITDNSLDVGAASDIYWRSVVYGAAQEAYVTLSTIDTDATEIGLILKAQSRSGLGAGLLEVYYSPQAGTVQVSTYTSGIGWQLQGIPQLVTLVNGDRFGARALADGNVEVYVNNALLGTWSTTGWDYASSGGYIGIFTLDAGNAVLDDFEGGTVGDGAGDIDQEAFVEDDHPEEFAMLRYKSNLWLPTIGAWLEAIPLTSPDLPTPQIEEERSSNLEPEWLYLPLLQHQE